MAATGRRPINPFPKGNKLAPKPFTSEHQPSPKNKALFWQRKKFTREVLQEFLQGHFNLSEAHKKQFAEKFGIDPDKVTVGMAGALQQAIQMMSSGTITKASWEALMNQAFGLPKQPTELTGKDGMPLIPITGMQIVKDEPKI